MLTRYHTVVLSSRGKIWNTYMHLFSVFYIPIKQFSRFRSGFNFQFSATNKSTKWRVTRGSSSYYPIPGFSVYGIMFSLYLMSREKESWKLNIIFYQYLCTDSRDSRDNAMGKAVQSQDCAGLCNNSSGCER